MITSLALYFTYFIHGMAGQIGEGGNMHKYSIAIVAGVGFGLNLLLSNWKPGQKEIESTEE